MPEHAAYSGRYAASPDHEAAAGRDDVDAIDDAEYEDGCRGEGGIAGEIEVVFGFCAGVVKSFGWVSERGADFPVVGYG